MILADLEDLDQEQDRQRAQQQAPDLTQPAA
jgi:hypothetical protein